MKKFFKSVGCGDDDVLETSEDKSPAGGVDTVSDNGTENEIAPSDVANTPASDTARSQTSETVAADVQSPDGQGSANGQPLAPVVGAVGEEPESKEQTYSQADVDELNRQIECLEGLRQTGAEQLNKVQESLRKVEKDLNAAKNVPRQLENSIVGIYKRLGGLSHSEVASVVLELADLQLKNAEMAAIREERDDAVRNLNATKMDIDRLRNEVKNLEEKVAKREKEFAEFSADKSAMESKNEKLEKERDQARNESEGWRNLGGRLLVAMSPMVLREKDWWEGFKEDLWVDVSADFPDAAMLVWAALSEFAVFERMPETPAIESEKLGKQLSDIGYVVANYVRQKETEDAVVRMLKKFAESLNASPLVRNGEFSLRVPAVGEAVNTDEMRSLRGGTTVENVVNWCILKNGRVYSKAVVE